MEPPTATMVICPALSWRRRPDSGLGVVGIGIEARYEYDITRATL
jgi:hypothetical protein